MVIITSVQCEWCVCMVLTGVSVGSLIPIMVHFLAAICLLLSIVSLETQATFIYRENPMALLSTTLRTEQKAACDDEYLALTCPNRTAISIKLTHYGRKAIAKTHLTPSHIVCPPKDIRLLTKQDIRRYNVTCLGSEALKYSLLQTVVNTCQPKRECKLLTSPKTFDGDPCPTLRKYVEVAYKCMPEQFQSKVVCQNDSVQLSCDPMDRLVIYSGTFGRNKYGSRSCPQTPGMQEEDCEASYATETVMHTCHGRRRCDLNANPSVFGKPCSPQSNMYLKVVYTCVAMRILKDQWRSPPEPDEKLPENTQTAQGNWYSSVTRWPPTSKPHDYAPQGQNHITGVYPSFSTPGEMQGDAVLNRNRGGIGRPEEQQKTEELNTGFINDWISAYSFMKGNKEKLILYIVVSTTSALLIFLAVVLGRMALQRHRKRRQDPGTTASHSRDHLANGFSDQLSDFGDDLVDISLTSTLKDEFSGVRRNSGHQQHQGSSIGVIRYSTIKRGTGTLKRQNSDTNPRSLNRDLDNHELYA